MTEELKPCPFCGGEADIMARCGYKNRWFVFAKCKICDAQSKVKNVPGDPDDDGFWERDAVFSVADSWNRRAKDG